MPGESTMGRWSISHGVHLMGIRGVRLHNNVEHICFFNNLFVEMCDSLQLTCLYMYPSFNLLPQ